MNKEDILEGNRLLCDFMGIKVYNGVWDTGHVVQYERVFRQSCISDLEIGFNTSWDWLMPVWKKIIDIDIDINLYKESDGWCAYYAIESFLAMADIEKVYEYIVQFIKWYNNK